MKKFLTVFTLYLLLLSSCQKDTVDFFSEQEESMVVTQDGLQLDPSSLEQGHVRLHLSDDMLLLAETAPEAFRAKMSSLGVKSVERTFPDAGKFEARSRKAGLHRWYDVYFDESIPLTKAGEELSLIENLGYVEYRPKMVRIESQNVSWRSASPGLFSPEGLQATSSKVDIFDDPMLPEQWHYYNDGSMDGSRVGCDINVLPVWKDITTGSPEVIVAVVDGGIDFNHVDLADNMWHNPEFSGDSVYGYNFARKKYLIEPEDHGTHVAGTVAAVNNNGIGVSGVAGGNKAAGQPGVKLMSCQIFLPRNSRRSGDGAAAIKWGADHGAVISQNSWGYIGGMGKNIPQSDKEAIDYFNTYAGIDENGEQVGPMKGGVVFFSAGNENKSYDALSSYEGVVGVAAVDARYKRAGYSNYGEWIDVAAPGGDSDFGPIVLSTVTGNKYDYYEGTSMACPHVSGVAALIVSALGGPGFTREMLIDRIVNNTTDLSLYGTKDIAGLLNAYSAFKGSSSKVAPDSVADYRLSIVSNRILFRLRVPEDADEGAAYGITAWYSTSPFEMRTDAMSRVFELGGLKAGDYLEDEIDDLEFNQKYYLAFDAFDMSGNHSAMSLRSEIFTEGNSSPEIVPEDPLENIIVRFLDTRDLHIAYNDPDGHDVSLVFEDNSGGAATMTDLPDKNKVIVKINGKAAPAGHYQFRLTVTDKYGAQATIEVPYVITLNTPPVKLKDIGDMVLDIRGDRPELNLDGYFFDPDGERLGVKCSVSNTRVVSVTVAASGNLAIKPLTVGTAGVTVTGTDYMGETVSTSFRILVRDASQPFDIYPNPVVDGKLYIRSGNATSVNVVVGSQSGALVLNGSTSAGPFDPAVIDLASCSPGVYSVKVSNSKESVTKSIVIINND